MKRKILFLMIGLLSFVGCTSDFSREEQDYEMEKSQMVLREVNPKEHSSQKIMSPSTLSVLTRYYSSRTNKHWYNANPGWIPLPDYYYNQFLGYYNEGSLGQIQQENGSTPIYAYAASHKDFFMTTNPQIHDLTGYTELGIIGYSSGPNPIYQYYNNSKKAHFYTNNFSELFNGGQGYVYEGVAFYVY